MLSVSSILKYLSSCYFGCSPQSPSPSFCLLFFFAGGFFFFSPLALNFVACDLPQVGNISCSWDSLLHCNYPFLYFVSKCLGFFFFFNLFEGNSFFHALGCSSCFFSYWKANTCLRSKAHTAINDNLTKH